MKTIACLTVLILFAACSEGSSSTAPSTAAAVTQWNVQPAIGMDALLLVGAASGDVMQANYYSKEIAAVRAKMSAQGLAALDTLDGVLRQKLGRLTGPTLAYFFSAGPVATLDDVIASAADPLARLKPGLQASPNWDEQEFESTLQLVPAVHTALVALRETGFDEQYREDTLPDIDKAITDGYADVVSQDIIPEQERLLGRELDPQVDIIIVNYAKPYGMRILGQRFVAYYGWDAETQLRIAAHEIFHPPYDENDLELIELLADLRADPWMQSIVEDHDPQYGYNSFEGVVNEGSTQALDQIVSERLGFAKDPGARWRESDGGMHMFAAALYQAMRESGFADKGSNFSEWFKDALRSGMLSPSEVQRRATLIAGPGAVEAWGPHRSANLGP